jgi:chromosome segregation ATPase
MSRAKFQESDVIRVGIALRDAGRHVNGWSLRQELGGGKSERLMKIWAASPEGRRYIEKPPKGRIDPKAVQKALDTIKTAALAALEELDSTVSARMQRQDEDHAAELMSSIRWAEGLDDMVEHQIAEWSERAAEANGRAAKAEAEAAAVPGLRQELADVRTLLQAAQAAEASLRAEADRLTSELASAIASRDEAAARAAAAEQRERHALERAARAEGALEALRTQPKQ